MKIYTVANETISKDTVDNKKFNFSDFVDAISSVMCDVSPSIDPEMKKKRTDLDAKTKHLEDLNEFIKTSKTIIMERQKILNEAKQKNKILAFIYGLMTNSKIGFTDASKMQLQRLIQNIDTYSLVNLEKTYRSLTEFAKSLNVGR